MTETDETIVALGGEGEEGSLNEKEKSMKSVWLDG